MKSLLIVCAFVAGSLFLEAEDQPGPFFSAAHQEENEKRKALWTAFFKAWPVNKKKIDVYAENKSLTLICFRSERQTYIYELGKAKAEIVNHAKVLPPDIQSITYQAESETLSGSFILWRYGERELSIGASR